MGFDDSPASVPWCPALVVVAPRLQHIQLKAARDHVCVVFILAGAYSFILLGLSARPDGTSYKTQ